MPLRLVVYKYGDGHSLELESSELGESSVTLAGGKSRRYDVAEVCSVAERKLLRLVQRCRTERDKALQAKEGKNARTIATRK